MSIPGQYHVITMTVPYLYLGHQGSTMYCIVALLGQFNAKLFRNVESEEITLNWDQNAMLCNTIDVRTTMLIMVGVNDALFQMICLLAIRLQLQFSRVL